MATFGGFVKEKSTSKARLERWISLLQIGCLDGNEKAATLYGIGTN